MLRQRHGGSGGNRDPLVSRAKQQIKLEADPPTLQRKNGLTVPKIAPGIKQPALK